MRDSSSICFIFLNRKCFFPNNAYSSISLIVHSVIPVLIQLTLLSTLIRSAVEHHFNENTATVL